MSLALPDTQVDVGHMAGQIGRELDRLASEVEHLQSMLSDLLCAASPDSKLVVQAQALDHAFQSMSQLSGVLDRIAMQASPDWRLTLPTLLAPVSLSEMAKRLAGLPSSLIPADDLELF